MSYIWAWQCISYFYWPNPEIKDGYVTSNLIGPHKPVDTLQCPQFVLEIQLSPPTLIIDLRGPVCPLALIHTIKPGLHVQMDLFVPSFNTWWLKQNGCQCCRQHFQKHFLQWNPCCPLSTKRLLNFNENICILIHISLFIPSVFIPKGPNDNDAALVEIMMWCHTIRSNDGLIYWYYAFSEIDFSQHIMSKIFIFGECILVLGKSLKCPGKVLKMSWESP